MKDLIIVGAGGMGRKVLVCLKRLNTENKWNIKGFLDDNEHALEGKKCDLKIIGKISDWNPTENQVFVMGISEPHTKRIVSELLIRKGAFFETIISPDVILGDYVEIGEGSVIMTPYNVESGCKIGKFVTMLGSTIAIDGKLGDYSTTTGFANLTYANIGKEVYVGSHAVILSNVTIGNGAYIGAGSIVMKDVPSYTQVFGNPARIVGERKRYE